MHCNLPVCFLWGNKQDAFFFFFFCSEWYDLFSDVTLNRCHILDSDLFFAGWWWTLRAHAKDLGQSLNIAVSVPREVPCDPESLLCFAYRCCLETLLPLSLRGKTTGSPLLGPHLQARTASGHTACLHPCAPSYTSKPLFWVERT